MRRIWGSVTVGVVLSIALAGCTAPEPPPKAHPAVEVTPSPTPTVPAITAPKPSVPLTCDQLVPQTVLNSLAPGLSLTNQDTRLWIGSAVARQAGVLACEWSQQGATRPALTISVVSDGKAGFDASLTKAFSSLGLGDASGGECDGSVDVTGCTASVLVGRYWAYLITNETGLTTKQADTTLRAIAGSTADQLSRAGDPVAGWAMPSTVWSPVRSCGQLASGVSMADVFTSSAPATAEEWNGSGNEDAAWVWAVYSSHSSFYNCAWSWPGAKEEDAQNNALLISQIVPGAEWAWPLLAAQPDVTSIAMTVPGADAAFYRCQAGTSSCWADALVNHSWIQATLTSSATDHPVDVLTRALADLASFKGA